ncbi:MAG TPA: S8 family serine peptidase, partial [Candidatus Limnocylindrales bacterium]|nr:S8 family serine peptidase [Candidatus Limnocylindrales bacterium]
NEGSGAYVTGTPASADRAISVAALDASRATVPGAHAVFSNTAGTVDLQDSNEAPFPEGQTLPVKVLRDASGGVSLGCDPKEYTGVTGALVVTLRGTCARVARAIYGQQAGAAAVVMINTDAAYPPMEGTITSNPDTGEPFDVTIPFFGAPGTAAAAQALVAADGGNVTLTHTDIANPGYQRLASFTSGGPRNGDSAAKPDVTAPGVAVLSTGVGTGWDAATISGTSQASPMTAGAAALITQAHPDWSTERIKAAIMNTADPSLDKSYNVRLSGAGVVQVQRAIDTKADILAGNGQSTLSYGAEQLGSAYSESLPMTIENTGSSALTYQITSQFNGSALGAAISASPSSVTVPAGGTRTVQVTLSLSAAQVAALPAAETSTFGTIVTIRGVVLATPASTGAGVYQLRVPFLVAPRGISDVDASKASGTHPTAGAGNKATSVVVTNSGIHAGNADVYAWNIADPQDSDRYVDVRAAGVQSLPGAALGGSADDRALIFAVNMHHAWSTPDVMEVDIPLDTNGDGSADAYVIGIDFGLVTAGDDNGQYVALTTDADFNIIDAWVADAPMNTSTMELPALASELGLSAAHPSFAYAVASFDRDGPATDATAAGFFNAWHPAVSTGAFEALDPGDSATIGLSFNRPAAQTSKTRGWMIVTLDDPSGAAQAELVRLPPH